MRLLFIGDIVGKAGRTVLRALLPNIVDKFKTDFIVANGENIAAGFGLTEALVLELYKMGIHVVTTGNHVWDKREFANYIAKDNRVLRPLNYPPGVPGAGRVVLNALDGTKVAVINVSGRVFMSYNLDCPFRSTDNELKKMEKEADIVIVDFHAEATSEKVAFGYFLDGRVSAIIGTHTHVQTADEKILPKGTAYITDVGMTGPAFSVIGIEVNQIIERFLTNMPARFEIAPGNSVLSAVVVDISNGTGKATAIQRLQIGYP